MHETNTKTRPAAAQRYADTEPGCGTAMQEKETIADQVDDLVEGMFELNTVLGSVSGFITSRPTNGMCDKMGSGADLQGKLAFLQASLRDALREANTIHRDLGCCREGQDPTMSPC